jgi:hypothetical protein
MLDLYEVVLKVDNNKKSLYSIPSVMHELKCSFRAKISTGIL